MFTERQLRLIEKAINYGYGYASFAHSVKKQGWCSPKQEETLDKLISSAEYRKNNLSTRKSRSKKWYKHDISDCEAMQSGDYF